MEGLVNIYSMSLRKRPEYSLKCSSEVTSAIFSPFHNNIVVGGTYSGGLVIWDIRAKSTPVKKTSLPSENHTYPIFGLEMIGTSNGNTIVSMSNDGTCCTWSNLSLDKPLKNLNFSKQQNVVSCTAMCFAEEETNHFFFGSEESQIFAAQLHLSSSKEESNINKQYSGHESAINSLHLHPRSSHPSLGDLLLSSSNDWTVRVWDTKQREIPLHSFETSDEIVFDAQWSPIHPSLFVSGDGEGYIDIWDMNKNIEDPLIH